MTFLRMKNSIVTVCIMFLLSGIAWTQAVPGRWETSLSGGDWTLRLDREAEWIGDELFLPGTDVSLIPSNPPSPGWDVFGLMEGKRVTVPGTVEEHYWGANGNPIGNAGDFRGVSWWSRTFELNSELRGKRIILACDAINLRAEIYVNQKLTGYDVVANTPFEVDITDAVIFGGVNALDIRITDPVGNFSWPAHVTFPWGTYNIPAVRGFGGITGDITLRALDMVSVDDIHVINKPSVTSADIVVTLGNTSGATQDGEITLTVHEWKKPDTIIWEKTVAGPVGSDGGEVTFKVKAPKAKPWGIYDPNLYVAKVTYNGSAGDISDTAVRRFGFRWFDIGEKDGDQRLYLNGKRIFIRGCKNRTFWPTNGIYASPEWAKRDVELVIEMGYNAIKVTNAIAPSNHVSYCEELGVLYTGRSSGYRINGDDRAPIKDPFTRALRRENLMRFVRRDRSSPALFFWSLKGEDSNPPDEDDFRNMEKVRELDDTRIFVYNGGRDRTKKRPHINDPDSPAKSFYKPLDPKRYTHGWWDMHHWGHAGYRDNYYRNPRNYLRLNIADGDSTYQVLKDEVLYYGEEGSFGSMVRLGKIKEQIDRQGTSDGWREREILNWHDYYDRFLDEAGFRSSYPTVDHLTRALGSNLFYFHGRILENCRVSNIIDAYIVNGAASGATHTDMFDIYRNPTGDPAVLSYYSQSLYIAVKLRNKVMPVGDTPVADIYIVNEENLHGRQTLEIAVIDPDGLMVHRDSKKVTVAGGEDYGQLLIEGLALPAVTKHGHYTLKVRIPGKNGDTCSGFDDLFAVDVSPDETLAGRVALIDTSGTIDAFLEDTTGLKAEGFINDRRKYDCIIVGGHDFSDVAKTVYRPVMEQVLNGATLIVLDNADEWAEEWDDVYWYQAVQYGGSHNRGNRGRLFVGKSPLLDGLPVSQAMGWEYQVFYGGRVWGLDIGRFGHETVVGLAAEHRREILTSVARIPYGNGRIIVSTLEMMSNLRSKRPQSAIAKKLFLNFLEYTDK
ncbi:sugar-binding domain-containing protein [Candidatus Latescibacterota bacterium]